jgi:hypothetical protein
MKQDIKNKIQHIISNQEADEKEMLFQLKGNCFMKPNCKTKLQRESKNIADLVSENLTQLQRRNTSR